MYGVHAIAERLGREDLCDIFWRGIVNERKGWGRESSLPPTMVSLRMVQLANAPRPNFPRMMTVCYRNNIVWSPWVTKIYQGTAKKKKKTPGNFRAVYPHSRTPFSYCAPQEIRYLFFFTLGITLTFFLPLSKTKNKKQNPNQDWECWRNGNDAKLTLRRMKCTGQDHTPSPPHDTDIDHCMLSV